MLLSCTPSVTMPTFDHRQAVAGAGVGIEVTLQDLAQVAEEVVAVSALVRLTLKAFCRVLFTTTPLVNMQPLERRLREVVASTGGGCELALSGIARVANGSAMMSATLCCLER